MLYNPAIGSLILEMLSCRIVVVPVPQGFPGKIFQELYEYMVRRKNLITIALLRDFEEANEDLEDEAQEEAPEEFGVRMEAVEAKKRYNPRDPPGSRFIYTMPTGDRSILPGDGIMCIVPKGDSLAFLE